MKPLTMLAFVCALCALSGCSPTGQQPLSGGGNDFPNPPSAAALGQVITDNLAKGDHWADSIALPAASSPAALAQGITVPSAAQTGMAKMAAKSQTLRFDLSDTAYGIVNVYYGFVSDTVIKTDTFVILYDNAFRDGIKDNEHLYMLKGASFNKQTLIRSSYLFVDSDGDSAINNRNGKPNRVLASFATMAPTGQIAKFEILLEAGQDGNLDTKAGLRILQSQSFTLSSHGDTLSMVRYEKYGDDSVIFDAASRDSILVRARFIDIDILSRRTTAEAVFLIFPSDSNKNRPAYFRSVKSFASGVTATSLVRGPGADSLFTGNDTALGYIILDNPDGIVSVDTLRLLILTGSNPANPAGNALKGLYSHKTRRAADERETIVSLMCDQPVASGDTVESGTFSLKLLYTDDRSITVVGSFTPVAITAQYEDSKGNTRKLDWDRSGKPQ
jgi:hypothetical protein